MSFNKLEYSRGYHTCVDCGVTQSKADLKRRILPRGDEWVCKDAGRCARWKAEVKSRVNL